MKLKHSKWGALLHFSLPRSSVRICPKIALSLALLLITRHCLTKRYPINSVIWSETDTQARASLSRRNNFAEVIFHFAPENCGGRIIKNWESDSPLLKSIPSCYLLPLRWADVFRCSILIYLGHGGLPHQQQQLHEKITDVTEKGVLEATHSCMKLSSTKVRG